MTFQRTFSIQWHITDRCDQRCKHCYVFGNSGNQKLLNEMNLSHCYNVIDKFIDFCEKMESNTHINLTGGDPLLHPDIWHILNYLKKKEVPFSIMGNPFHLNLEVCHRLSEMGCNDYQMSLDGLEKTHDFFRKNGSFKSTIQALDWLKAAEIRTVIMNTVSDVNFKELVPLIRLVTDLNVEVFGFARYSPTAKNECSSIGSFEYRQLLSDVWDVYVELSDKTTIFTLKEHLFSLLLYEKGLLDVPKEKIVIDGCGCGIRHMTVLPDGAVFACRRFFSPIGNINFQSFSDIFLGLEMEKFRLIEDLDGCKDCELLYCCRGCHAVSYGTYGSFFAKDPQCWKTAC